MKSLMMSSAEASTMARAWFKQVADDVKRSSTPAPAPSPNKMTVIQAVESYLEYLIAEKKGGKQAETAAKHYILSKPIGNRLGCPKGRAGHRLRQPPESDLKKFGVPHWVPSVRLSGQSS